MSRTFPESDNVSEHNASMCYNAPVDTTIRNLDEETYRALKARAARSGRTIGEAVNEAVRFYLAAPSPHDRRGSLLDLEPEPYPPGNERLSEEVDRVVYGIDG